MPIETNEQPQTTQQPSPSETPGDRRENQNFHTDFEGAKFGMPSARSSFLALQSKIGISRIDKTIEPYINSVMELVKDNLPNVNLDKMSRLANSFAVKYEGEDGTLNFFGLYFASMSDPKSTKFLPTSLRLALILEELRTNYPGRKIRLADARVVIAGYQPEMDRFAEMANTIVSTFQVTSFSEVKNVTVDVLQGNDFVVDWRVSEARLTEAQLSPMGVRPRMDIGMTLKVKVRNEWGQGNRDLDVDYRTVGVIGGFTEIRDKEPVQRPDGTTAMLYRPVFNITVCASQIPLEGMGLMLIALAAPTIYNSKHWAKQFSDFARDKANIGLLEEDRNNRGNPEFVKDQDELQQFIDGLFAQPIITYQFLDGADAIPGMVRMTLQDGQSKSHFVNRIAQFLEASEDNVANNVLSTVIETRYDGVYGDPSGQLHDTRNIDYFYVANNGGYGNVDPFQRRVLLGGSEDPIDRARIVENATGGFTPLYLDNVAAINPEFIRWVIQKMDQKGIVVSDPDSRLEARPLGSMLAGFGNAANMGTIVTSGVTGRGSGLNLNSIWSRWN